MPRLTAPTNVPDGYTEQLTELLQEWGATDVRITDNVATFTGADAVLQAVRVGVSLQAQWVGAVVEED